MVVINTTMVSSPKVSQSDVKSSVGMKVYVRVRPYNIRESKANLRSIINVFNKHELEFDPKEDDQPFFYHGVKQKWRDVAKKQNKQIKFTFDRIYDGTCTTGDLYHESIKNMLPSLLEGYNCSVFVYGPTGTGKTFTMTGNDRAPGITYLLMADLFTKMTELKETKIFELAASYVEVYNETVRDLLKPSSRPLELREDAVNGVMVTNMRMIPVESADRLLRLLQQGNSNRTQHPTDANAESSRSHAVFQVFFRIRDKQSNQLKRVKLSMIDLAGSEKGAATNFTGLRFKEGANINKSLLALGNCINKLADGVKHVPYRDSKLTRLLKDSLGGNSQTVMIACVSATERSYEDTYNTLKYATRAQAIRVTLSKSIIKTRAEDQHRAIIKEMQETINGLQNSVNVWKAKYESAMRKIELLENGTLPNMNDAVIKGFNDDGDGDCFQNMENMIKEFSLKTPIKRKPSDYCSMSLNNLQQFKKPCLRIIGNKENVNNRRVNSDQNATYTI